MFYSVPCLRVMPDEIELTSKPTILLSFFLSSSMFLLLLRLCRNEWTTKANLSNAIHSREDLLLHKCRRFGTGSQSSDPLE